MIARIWHGWTTCENSERYQKLLREEVLLEIARRSIPGYKLRASANHMRPVIHVLRKQTHANHAKCGYDK